MALSNLNFPKGDEHVEHDVAREDVGIVQPPLHVVQRLWEGLPGVLLAALAEVGQELFLHVHLWLNLEVLEQVLQLGHEADLEVVRYDGGRVSDDQAARPVRDPLVRDEGVVGAGELQRQRYLLVNILQQWFYVYNVYIFSIK